MSIVICIELEECEWEGIILKPRKKLLHIFIKVMIIDFMSILSFIMYFCLNNHIWQPLNYKYVYLFLFF